MFAKALLCLLIVVGSSTSAMAQPYGELSILAYSAWPQRLDWTSPGSLFRSYADNAVLSAMGHWKPMPRFDDTRGEEMVYAYDQYPHPIGHLHIKLTCPGMVEPLYVGMTSDDRFEDVKRVLLDGVGLDVLVRNYHGQFKATKDILEWLPELKQRGLVRELSYLISPQLCERAHRYYLEYRERNYHKIFGGLAADPLRGEGAGCAAFAVSFLRVSGLYNKSFDKHWKRSLALPHRLMSTNERPSEIGFWGFVMHGQNGRWAEPGEMQTRIEFWDPQLIYDWIGSVEQGHTTQGVRWRYRVLRDGQFVKLQIDARGAPLPVTPIWNIPQ